MPRIMRRGFLNLLVLLVLSTKLMNILHAQRPLNEPMSAPPIGSSPVPSPPPNTPGPPGRPGPAPQPLPPTTPIGSSLVPSSSTLGPPSRRGRAPQPLPPTTPPIGSSSVPPPSPSSPGPPGGPRLAAQPLPPTIPQLSPPPPAPLPQPAFSATQGSRGLSGGQKALGVLAGAGLIGFTGMVCIKRNNTIRRAQYAEYASKRDL